jgi:RimJ/RimL family protein N-acetyltransferase
MNRSFDVTALEDKDVIRVFLNRDRRLVAYALGDLDDKYWPQSSFYGAHCDGELRSIVLLYRGLDPTVLTAFGEIAGVQAVFEAVALPDEIYYLFLPELEAVLDAHYVRPHAQREWRMALEVDRFQSPGLDGVERIGPDQANQLAALYRHAAEPGEEIVAFRPWQIAYGAFFGVRQGGELVAAAGTHVWSTTEGVAAIGNVFTRPDHRGRGYATRCTAAIVAEALESRIDTVILNVREGNRPAIRVYEKLGFRWYHTFLEGPGLKRA